MNPALAPEVVLEQPAPCGDAAEAEPLLKQILRDSFVPRAGWAVHVRMTRDARALHGEADIVDGEGAVVAHRTVLAVSPQCASIVRAIGVWAQLVFDEETERVERDEREAAAAPAPEPSPPTRAPDSAAPARRARDASAGAPEKDGHTLDLGVGTFAMAGTGPRIVAGPALFTIVGGGRGWFVRPEIAFGRSLSAVDWTEWWSAVRIDGCGRAIGASRGERNAWYLDLCGGAEIGGHQYTVADPTGSLQPSFELLLGAGPSAAVRHDFAGGPSFELRVTGGLNVGGLLQARPDDSMTIHASSLVGRVELGAYWRTGASP